MSDDWSDDELAAAVDAYDEMSRLEALQKPYSKKEFYRTLAGKYSRSEKAFEFRMQNISAVRDELKMGWIPGLKPAKNVGTNVRPRLVKLIERPVKSKSSTAAPAPYKTKLPATVRYLL